MVEKLKIDESFKTLKIVITSFQARSSSIKATPNRNQELDMVLLSWFDLLSWELLLL